MSLVCSSGRSGRTALAALGVATAVLVAVAPASAHPESPRSRPRADAGGDSHLENPRHGLEEVGFHPLHGTGFNTDVWTQVTDDGRLFAYSGTWGTLTGSADPGQECPSDTDDPARPTQSGVKVVDASNPADPEMVAALGTVPGAQNNDVKVVEGVATASFQGDLLVHSLEPCGVNLAAGVVDVGNDVPREQTGFQLYDVTDPARPKRLGDFNNGGLGTHNLYAFDRPGKAFVAAVHNDLDLVTGEDVVGTVQFVDVSDPAAPALVSEWRLADAEQQGGATFDELCKPRGDHSASCYLHDVWVSDDGTTAYLSYWDAGLVLLDLADPARPRLIGQIQPGGTDNEGNTHAAVPYRFAGKHLVIVGDEDFVGPGPAPQAVVAAAPAGAPVQPGEEWRGSEMSNTTPLAEVAPVGPFPALEADNHTACTFITAGSFAATSGLDGWLGVARRGTCTFQQTVTNAEAAGADGLVMVTDQPEGTEAGTAAGTIPALLIAREPGERLLEAVSPTTADVELTLDLLPTEQLNPWGFMRVVDVTDPDPRNWQEVSTFKAPHVDTLSGQDPANVFSAHNPIVGPDGRVYFSWYTDGVRVLEPRQAGGGFQETAWFVPLASDHPDDNDSDPHGAQEDNVGFWGSKAVEYNGELLVFNSDLNRGLYILRATAATASGNGPDPRNGGNGGPASGQPGAQARGLLPSTGGGLVAAGFLALAGAALARRRRG